MAAACAVQPEEEAAPTTEQAYGEAQAVAVQGAAPAAAAVGNFTEIARGYLNLNNVFTYQNPTGNLLKVTVTGCQLATLGVSAQDSNLTTNFLPAPMGLGTNGFANSYVGLWRLPYNSNLGTITVVGTAYGGHQSCYVVVEQSGGGYNPPPPPPPPAACQGLNQFSCQLNPACRPVFQTVWLGWSYGQQYVGCTQAAGQQCGNTTCAAGLVCCNSLAGICTPPGMACAQ